tara:strand:+ start:418 stop:984 length:567 start_codon:yes stop_codon:yes gene_type:complete
MNFNKEKKEFLEKEDKSRKGFVDKKIKKLVDKINSLDDFFTTSSCSGRVLIATIPKPNKKNEVRYLFNLHDKVKNNEIRKILETDWPKGDVWFRVDGTIIHIASKNIEKAKKLMNIARDIGFRRSGIISMGKNRITLELISTENIETIISKKGKLLVDESYLKILIKEANKKLERSWRKVDKLYKTLN